MRAPAFAFAWLPALAAVGLCATGGGCDWRDFDNLQNHTPALSVGTPSGYTSPNDFGKVILAVTPPSDGSAAARFLGAGTINAALAVVDLSPSGQPSAVIPNLDVLGGWPIVSMAQVPGGVKALIGASTLTSGGDGMVAVLPLTPPFGDLAMFVELSEAGFGSGVAAGGVTGLVSGDYVAVSDSALHVFPDGQMPELAPALSSADCPIALGPGLPSSERINRAVVIGGLLAGGGLQIAVGTPASGGAAGSVSFFTASTSSNAVACVAGATLTSPTMESQFGQALAVGDFNGDGAADLLVGAPPTHAYLYRGPIAPGAQPSATITSPGGVAFGAALTAFNLDGQPGDEAFIADPEVTLGGDTDAGNVSIYSGPLLGTKLMQVLADNAPSTGELYGSAVTSLPFCATAPCASPAPRLPLVGTASKVFTYFTLGPTDPRAK